MNTSQQPTQRLDGIHGAGPQSELSLGSRDSSGMQGGLQSHPTRAPTATSQRSASSLQHVLQQGWILSQPRRSSSRTSKRSILQLEPLPVVSESNHYASLEEQIIEQQEAEEWAEENRRRQREVALAQEQQEEQTRVERQQQHMQQVQQQQQQLQQHQPQHQLQQQQQQQQRQQQQRQQQLRPDSGSLGARSSMRPGRPTNAASHPPPGPGQPQITSLFSPSPGAPADEETYVPATQHELEETGSLGSRSGDDHQMGGSAVSRSQRSTRSLSPTRRRSHSSHSRSRGGNRSGSDASQSHSPSDLNLSPSNRSSFSGGEDDR
jgi:flagellar biosynthesis GTPase FlhF